jgi:hypothetical protein
MVLKGGLQECLCHALVLLAWPSWGHFSGKGWILALLQGRHGNQVSQVSEM